VPVRIYFITYFERTLFSILIILACLTSSAEASDEQPCGLLCHIQPSRIVANIILSNEFLGLESTDSSGSKHHSMPFSTTHRVMFREGVDIYSGASEDKRIGHLSYGDYVVIAKRESQSKWAQVTLPISGWCRMYLEQNDKYICERSGAELTAKNVIPLLQPIKEMMFNRFGGTRTHGNEVLIVVRLSRFLIIFCSQI
jgi:hypothetical protein